VPPTEVPVGACGKTDELRNQAPTFDCVEPGRQAGLVSRGAFRAGLSVLTYRCPATGLEVETAIATSRDVLRRMNLLQISLWCPHCKTSHQIVAKSASSDH
jgi:hypothetical protein